MKSALYQIVNLGTPKWKDIPEELSSHNIDFVEDANVDGNYPCLYLYWGASNADSQYNGAVDFGKMICAGSILPIVEDAAKFRDFVPKALESVNALIYDVNGDKKLENHILAYFGLIEQNRKVFISYKRSDTSGVAIQLFDELTKLGYRPFLDSYSIEPGVDFQEYLKHELSDSDVFVFLNSKNYPKSQFTIEEIECAQKLNLGIVQIDFDGCVEEWNILNCAKVVMEPRKNMDYRLGIRKELLMDIIAKIEEKRAAFFEYRRKALIDTYRILHPAAKIVGERNNFVLDGCELSAFCVHIPKSTDLEKNEMDLSTYCSKTGLMCNKVLLYDAQFCRRDLFRHLKWLNGQMQKTIQTRDVNA